MLINEQLDYVFMGEYSCIVDWKKSICVWDELLSSILQKKIHNFISAIYASPVQGCKLGLMISGIYFYRMLISLIQNFLSFFLFDLILSLSI